MKQKQTAASPSTHIKHVPILIRNNDGAWVDGIQFRNNTVGLEKL